MKIRLLIGLAALGYILGIGTLVLVLIHLAILAFNGTGIPFESGDAAGAFAFITFFLGVVIAIPSSLALSDEYDAWQRQKERDRKNDADNLSTMELRRIAIRLEVEDPVDNYTTRGQVLTAIRKQIGLT